jgi:GDP-D-mannose dehydratase
LRVFLAVRPRSPSSKPRGKMSKRALITGITGMVGSHLLDYLLKHTDWEIHGMLRWRSPLDNISGHLDDINAGGSIN